MVKLGREIMKIIATNKKAYFDYFVISTYEAGLVLEGSEVKSIRKGNVNLKDTFIYFNSKEEVFVKNMFIKKFENFGGFEIDEKRDRKLLLNKSEIRKLASKIKEKGYSCVPLKICLKNNKFVKLEIGLVKGKKSFDKKESIKLNDIKREVEREMKNYR